MSYAIQVKQVIFQANKTLRYVLVSSWFSVQMVSNSVKGRAIFDSQLKGKSLFSLNKHAKINCADGCWLVHHSQNVPVVHKIQFPIYLHVYSVSSGERRVMLPYFSRKRNYCLRNLSACSTKRCATVYK